MWSNTNTKTEQQIQGFSKDPQFDLIQDFTPDDTNLLNTLLIYYMFITLKPFFVWQIKY